MRKQLIPGSPAREPGYEASSVHTVVHCYTLRKYIDFSAQLPIHSP